MNAKTANAASTRLNAQSARDDQMQERMDKISPRAGLAFAQEREAKDAANRKVFDEYKGGFLNFGKDIDGLDLSSTVMDYSGITDNKKVKTTPTPIDNSPDANPVSQLSTLPPSPAASDSGGTSALLTQEQKDLLSGNESQVEQVSEAVQQPQAPQLIDENRPDGQGQSAY